MLDEIQGMFAKHLGLVNGPEGYSPRHSLAWRNKLDEQGDVLQDRITFARSLMANALQFQTIICSENAMTIICQRNSSIRMAGNTVAHAYADNASDLYTLTAALDHVPLERSGMMDIISCLSSIRFPASIA